MKIPVLCWPRRHEGPSGITPEGPRGPHPKGRGYEVTPANASDATGNRASQQASSSALVSRSVMMKTSPGPVKASSDTVQNVSRSRSPGGPSASGCTVRGFAAIGARRAIRPPEEPWRQDRRAPGRRRDPSARERAPRLHRARRPVAHLPDDPTGLGHLDLRDPRAGERRLRPRAHGARGPRRDGSGRDDPSSRPSPPSSACGSSAPSPPWPDPRLGSQEILAFAEQVRPRVMIARTRLQGRTRRSRSRSPSGAAGSGRAPPSSSVVGRGSRCRCPRADGDEGLIVTAAHAGRPLPVVLFQPQLRTRGPALRGAVGASPRRRSSTPTRSSRSSIWCSGAR